MNGGERAKKKKRMPRLWGCVGAPGGCVSLFHHPHCHGHRSHTQTRGDARACTPTPPPPIPTHPGNDLGRRRPHAVLGVVLPVAALALAGRLAVPTPGRGPAVAAVTAQGDGDGRGWRGQAPAAGQAGASGRRPHCAAADTHWPGRQARGGGAGTAAGAAPGRGAGPSRHGGHRHGSGVVFGWGARAGRAREEGGGGGVCAAPGAAVSLFECEGVPFFVSLHPTARSLARPPLATPSPRAPLSHTHKKGSQSLSPLPTPSSK